MALSKTGERTRLEAADLSQGAAESPFDVLRGGLDALDRQMKQAERSYVDQMTKLAAELERALAAFQEAKAREEAAQHKIAALREILRE